MDLERFEPMSDHLAFELRPLAPLLGEVTLLIKACTMETATLDVQVPHLASQLEGPRAFAERILVIDSREDGFLKTAHARTRASCERWRTVWLKPDGWTGSSKDPGTASRRRRCTGGGSGSPLRARTPRPTPSSPRRSPGSRNAGHATSFTRMPTSWSAGSIASTNIWPTYSRRPRARAAGGGVRAWRRRDGGVDAAHRQGGGVSGLFRPATRTARRQCLAASALVSQATLQ